MPSKRFKYLTIRASTIAKSKREAKEIEAKLADLGLSVQIASHALDRCPGRPDGSGGFMDHAHASYNGVTWCPVCECELGPPRHFPPKGR